MTTYRTERATLPTSGRTVWLVVDNETLRPMPEARDFVLYLVGADHAENTIRTYVPRVTRFLNWAADAPDCDWRTVSVSQLARFKWSLEARQDRSVWPVAHSGRRPPAPSTINATLTAVIEFLRYCARAGHAPQATVERLVEPRYLSHMPSSFDEGEQGQFRYKRVKVLRARETFSAPKRLTEPQVNALINAATHARDRFLLVLLNATGLRIGEALGLRRSDMHFLPDSTSIGCETSGPHLHVVKRLDNPNGASAKSRRNRTVPVRNEVMHAYRDYQVERETTSDGIGSDLVFVNLWAGRIGSPMTYSSAYSLTLRLARRANIESMHPHLLRHTAATRWIADGVERDVAQELLGHLSPASTSIYTHPSDERLRAAVAHGAKSLEH